MPICRNCGFSQNVGEFIGGLCENCRSLNIQIANYQREEIVLNNQIEQLKNQLQAEKEKQANYLTRRKSQVEQEITLIREVLND